MNPRLSPCILATSCIPWTESFELEESIFREQIRGQIARGLTNLYLFGTAGEGHAITLPQFEGISRVFAEETEGRARLRQLGIIALSIPQVWERIEIGRSLGIDSFQLSFPSWGKLSDRETESFFENTCGRYPDCSFLFYNVSRGLRLLLPEEFGFLAERYSNVVAIKWATRMEEEAMKSAVESAPQLCHFFGDIGHIQASLAGLKCGLLLAMAESNSRLAHQLFELGQTRADDGRLRGYLEDIRHHSRIMKELPLHGSHMDGTFDKLLCKLHQPEFPLRLLPPYQGSTEEAFAIYRARLEAELPHWIESTPR